LSKGEDRAVSLNLFLCERPTRQTRAGALPPEEGKRGRNSGKEKKGAAC